MFSSGKDRAARKYEAGLAPELEAWHEAANSTGAWFDGTPESVDRRIAQCRHLQSGLRGAAGALAGTGKDLRYIAAERELEADRASLERLRRDLLTGAADREVAGSRRKSVRIRDEIRHGDYHDVRDVDVEDSLEGFLDFLNSGPYGGGNVAHPGNKWAVDAYNRFQNTGKSDFGWREFTRLPDGHEAARTAGRAGQDFPDALMHL